MYRLCWFYCSICVYHFLIRKGPTWTWNVLKRLPGGRGFVLTKYGPVGSHGDPIHAHFSDFRTPILCLASQMSTRKKTTCPIWTHKLFYVVQNDPLTLILFLFALPHPQHLRGYFSSLRASFQQNWVLLRSTISYCWETQYLIVETQEMCLVESQDICLVETQDMCCVGS